jgi:hypothetical protein
VIVKTSLIPKKFAAFTVWPFIFVKPSHVNDLPLIEHEKVHYKEQMKTLVLPWWFMYTVSKSFRLKAEIRAYTVQVMLGGLTVQRAVDFIMLYGTKVTRETATDMLEKSIEEARKYRRG